MSHRDKILILGLGNTILTDDGIGPRLVEDLQKKFKSPDISYETANLGGMELLEFFRGYTTVFILDAIKTFNGIPGSVYYLRPDNFKETLHVSCFHDISFLTALQLGKQLNLEMPDNIHILAVEIIEDLVFNDALSPPLDVAYPRILAEVEENLLSILQDQHPLVEVRSK